MRYYALLPAGLEKIAWRDISSKIQEVRLIEEGRGRLIFSYTGDIEPLIRLRSIESLYILIGIISNISRSRNSLGEIYKYVSASNMDEALMFHKKAHGGKGKKALTFRVISTMKGRHNFRRVDAQVAVETALTRSRRWKLKQESPILEFRLDVEEERALFSLRLTDEKVKKNYKVSHVPASLNPTVAHCMVLLSGINERDIFIDPMCGAGTILIERALAGRFKKIVGGDVDEGAVLSAVENVNKARLSIDIFHWDVNALPIHDSSVDKIVCNLPFGKQTGSQSENQILYGLFFNQATRILKPKGKAVLLTNEFDLMGELIKAAKAMRLIDRVSFDLSGLRSCIYVLQKHLG